MLKIAILILALVIVLSGCVEESKVNQSTEPVNQSSEPMQKESTNLSSTTLPREENIPEIKVTSFSSIYMHDNSDNAFGYLFSWDDVPGSEDYKLIDYLRNDLEINWVNNAQIIKTDDNNTIRVFTLNNSLELKLEDDKNTILLIPNHIQLKVKKDNSKLYVYKVEEDDLGSKTGYNMNERYYAVYGLSIRNSGSNNLNFNLNELHVRDGDHIFNATILDPYGFYVKSHSEVLSNRVLTNLEKENKIENTTLSSGQTISGSVAFQVNSFYNESFLLMYNATPIPSASFEKSIEALKITERYNYSVAFGVPPYRNIDVEAFEPNLVDYPCIYPNWINRGVFEFFNRADSESVLRSSPNDINFTRIVYALEVIPERNITMLPVKSHLIVVDDTGEELINASESEKIKILNQNYELHSREGENISNATIVRTSFERHGNMDVGIICFNNQDVILDDSQNLIAARYSNFGLHFP